MDWYRALLCCSAVCHLGLMPSGTVGSESSTNPMWTEPFEGVDRIQLVGCRKTVENGFQLMQLKDYNSSLLVSWVKEGSKCEAPGPYFAACVVDDAVSVVTLKVVVTDLQDGETRNFFCRAGYVLAEGLVYRDSNISVTYTVPTSVTSLAPTTTDGGSPGDKGNHAGSTDSQTGGFSVNEGVVFTIVGLLIFFATVCCVLFVLYYRGRRRNRRSRDCDAMSVRSGMTDKSFYAIELGGGRGSAGGGAGPGRITRQISSSSYVPAPKMLAPEVPGNRLVMQYQKPRDTVPDANTFTFSDRGYVSGSSVQYQEPWGRTLDDPEILDKLSTLRPPNRSLVKIPDFDATVTHPTAPPTQETAPASPEHSA